MSARHHRHRTSQAVPPNQNYDQTNQFWSQLAQTYFSDADPGLVEEVLKRCSDGSSLLLSEHIQKFSAQKQGQFAAFEFVTPGKKERKSLGSRGRKGQREKAQETGYKFGTLFSFYDHFQEFVNRLAAQADLQNPEEAGLLRENNVLDFNLQNPEQLQDTLLGYSLQTAEQKQSYSADFFAHPQSQSLDHQLQFLEKEHAIAQQQLQESVQDLKDRMDEDFSDEEPRFDEQGLELVKRQMVNQILGLEMKQLAESIEQIQAVRRPTKELLSLQVEPEYFDQKPDPEVNFQQKEYLIQFDLSLKHPTTWVSEKTFQCLNSLRSDMMNVRNRLAAGIKHSQAMKGDVPSRVEKAVLEDSVPTPETSRKPTPHRLTVSEQMKVAGENAEIFEDLPLQDRYGFCHQCKQAKSTYILAECNYNAKKHGFLQPLKQQVSNISVYNVDPQNTELVNLLLIKRAVKDKKRREFLESRIEYTCQRQFCGFCIKTCYDQTIAEIRNNPDWICPYCTGRCFCSRCMRQDQLTKLRAFYISLVQNQIQKSGARTKFHQVLGFQSPPQTYFDKIVCSNFEAFLKLSEAQVSETVFKPLLKESSQDRMNEYLLQVRDPTHKVLPLDVARSKAKKSSCLPVLLPKSKAPSERLLSSRTMKRRRKMLEDVKSKKAKVARLLELVKELKEDASSAEEESAEEEEEPKRVEKVRKPIQKQKSLNAPLLQSQKSSRFLKREQESYAHSLNSETTADASPKKELLQASEAKQALIQLSPAS